MWPTPDLHGTPHLERDLKRLDRFEAIILDDLGYAQQDRSEMEVLFTFLGERYERKSVFITSHLVFSKWNRIFKDAMTTAAAVDQLIHHSTILELTGESYRTNADIQRQKKPLGKYLWCLKGPFLPNPHFARAQRARRPGLPNPG